MQRDKLTGFARSMRKAPTEAKAALWRILRNRRFSRYKFRRQVPLGDGIVDFVCFEARLAVEADGSQHAESIRDIRRDAGSKPTAFASAVSGMRTYCAVAEVAETLWQDLTAPSSVPADAGTPSPTRGEEGG
jgi:Protein of unknown function (DUF559)